MRLIATVGLALMALGALGCTEAPAAPRLDTLTAEFAAAFNAHDAALVASFYTDDAQLTPPDAPPITGRAAIEAALEEVLADGCALELQSIESEIAANFGYDTGRFTLTMPLDGTEGGLYSVAGSYVAVFKRIGPEWKMAHHMLNPD